MTDWIHCNMCFKQPGNVIEGQLLLTGCGHIFCKACYESGSKERCNLCRTPTSYLPLQKKMPPEVEKYFLSPIELSKRHYKTLFQVAEFQNGHRGRLMSHYKEAFTKQGPLMSKVEKATDLERQVMVLQEQNAYLKKFIQKNQITSRPGGRPAGASPVKHGNLSPVTTGNANSPINMMRPQGNRMPFSQENAVSSSQVALSTGRISVRTPPLQGKMGLIPSPTSQQSPQSRASTPGQETPMVQSPQPSKPQQYRELPRIGPHIVRFPVTPVTPSTASSQASMFVTPPLQTSAGGDAVQRKPGGNSSDQRRPIQLNFPVQAGMSARLATQSPVVPFSKK